MWVFPKIRGSFLCGGVYTGGPPIYGDHNVGVWQLLGPQEVRIYIYIYMYSLTRVSIIYVHE